MPKITIEIPGLDKLKDLMEKHEKITEALDNNIMQIRGALLEIQAKINQE